MTNSPRLRDVANAGGAAGWPDLGRHRGGYLFWEAAPS